MFEAVVPELTLTSVAEHEDSCVSEVVGKRSLRVFSLFIRCLVVVSWLRSFGLIRCSSRVVNYSFLCVFKRLLFFSWFFFKLWGYKDWRRIWLQWLTWEILFDFAFTNLTLSFFFFLVHTVFNWDPERPCVWLCLLNGNFKLWFPFGHRIGDLAEWHIHFNRDSVRSSIRLNFLDGDVELGFPFTLSLRDLAECLIHTCIKSDSERSLIGPNFLNRNVELGFPLTDIWYHTHHTQLIMF